MTEYNTESVKYEGKRSEQIPDFNPRKGFEGSQNLMYKYGFFLQ